jgi:putative transcriptional regulator
MGIELSPGFLVASPLLLDPSFRRTVVLLVDHGSDGSLGFVINRPASVMLSGMVVKLGFQQGEVSPPEAPVLVGGPVAPDTGWIIFDPRGFPTVEDAAVKISDCIAVSASRSILEAVVHGKGPERLVLALGYAGWGAGQLDAEIERGAWIPTELDDKIVFDTPYNERWAQALASVGIDPARLSVMTPSEA